MHVTDYAFQLGNTHFSETHVRHTLQYSLLDSCLFTTVECAAIHLEGFFVFFNNLSAQEIYLWWFGKKKNIPQFLLSVQHFFISLV